MGCCFGRSTGPAKAQPDSRWTWAWLGSIILINRLIVKYYHLEVASKGSKTVSVDLAADGIQTQVDLEGLKLLKPQLS